MFFDIFKGDKPSNVIDFPVPQHTQTADTKEDDRWKSAAYTFGVNDHGMTQLKLGVATLTMNDSSVIALIEDLAHTMRHRYKVEITEIGNTET